MLEFLAAAEEIERSGKRLGMRAADRFQKIAGGFDDGPGSKTARFIALPGLHDGRNVGLTLAGYLNGGAADGAGRADDEEFRAFAYFEPVDRCERR